MSDARQTRAPAVIAPRLLTRTQAAAYCNVSIGIFSTACPVRPLSMGPDRRLERFDVRSLDEWIDAMGGKMPISADDDATEWLKKI